MEEIIEVEVQEVVEKPKYRTRFFVGSIVLLGLSLLFVFGFISLLIGYIAGVGLYETIPEIIVRILSGVGLAIWGLATAVFATVSSLFGFGFGLASVNHLKTNVQKVFAWIVSILNLIVALTVSIPLTLIAIFV